MRKSLIEQRFLDELLANDTSRLIWILPMGLLGQVPVKWGPALLRSRALWLSPYPEDSPLTAHFHFGVGRSTFSVRRFSPHPLPLYAQPL